MMTENEFLDLAAEMLKKNERRLRKRTRNDGKFTLADIFDRHTWKNIPTAEHSQLGIWFSAAVSKGYFPQILDAHQQNIHWHKIKKESNSNEKENHFRLYFVFLIDGVNYTVFCTSSMWILLAAN